MAAVEVHRNRLAQGQDAVGGRIAVMPVGERLAPGLDDMRRGQEIGLADAEIDDRLALRLERLGARQHLERRLGAERTHPRRQLYHANPPLPG